VDTFTDKIAIPGCRVLTGLFVFCLISSGWGCATTPSGQSGGDSRWWIPPGKSIDEARARPLRICLTDAPSPDHAPVPVERGERLIFGLLYETLTRFDDGAKVVPGLARAWEVDSAGLSWTILLAERRYSNGSRVQAGDVFLSWERSRELHPQWSFWNSVERVHAEDGTLRISLLQPLPDLPSQLADPRLAVAQFQGRGRWPVGTGSHVFRPGSGGRGSGVFEPNEVGRSVETARTLPGLGLDVRSDADPRDLPALGADVFLIESKEAAEFFAERPEEFAMFKLDPDRHYTLWTPLYWQTDVEPERLASLTVSALAAPLSGVATLVGIGVDTPGDIPPELSKIEDLYFDEDDEDARALAHGLAASVLPARVARGVRNDLLFATYMSESTRVNPRGFVLRHDSWREAERFYKEGVYRSLVETFPMLVVRRGVRGLGRTRNGGVDFSVARLVPVEAVP